MKIALLSYRLGGADGVAVVAGLWAEALRGLDCDVVTVAGAGEADRRVRGLAWPDDGESIDGVDVGRAVDDCDVVIVANVCSLPLGMAASRAVATALHGRRAVLHHHDLPWQREGFVAPSPWPPTGARWRHVVINDITRAELASRGIDAVVIRNAVDVDQPAGDRAATRSSLDVDASERLVLHPVRAIARKAVPAAVSLTERIGGTYWLTGPAEEGYPVDDVLAAARCRVIHRPAARIADAYAACDAVAFPSLWEGFGQPLLEAAVHRRPIAVGRYPVAEELRTFGFRWFDPDDPALLRAFVDHPDESAHDTNARVVREHFSVGRLRGELAALLADWERW